VGVGEMMLSDCFGPAVLSEVLPVRTTRNAHPEYKFGLRGLHAECAANSESSRFRHEVCVVCLHAASIKRQGKMANHEKVPSGNSAPTNRASAA
jgi:hypothetical protein